MVVGGSSAAGSCGCRAMVVAVEVGGDEETQALMAVKAGFGNVANALVDWYGGLDHCAWHGGACDSGSFVVVGMDLKLNKLTRQISDEIGDCVSLKYLRRACVCCCLKLGEIRRIHRPYLQLAEA